MTYQIADFSREMALELAIHRWATSPLTDLATIATALGSDTTTHDRTIENPPVALQILPTNGRFYNDAVHVVDKGKGGNLTAAAMATAINTLLASLPAPEISAAPVVSGTGTVGQTLTTTNGTWTNSPTSFAYQWRRGTNDIAGATSTTYVLIGTDSGTSISCRVMATNAFGTTSAISNAIAVA